MISGPASVRSPEQDPNSVFLESQLPEIDLLSRLAMSSWSVRTRDPVRIVDCWCWIVLRLTSLEMSLPLKCKMSANRIYF